MRNEEKQEPLYPLRIRLPGMLLMFTPADVRMQQDETLMRWKNTVGDEIDEILKRRWDEIRLERKHSRDINCFRWTTCSEMK